MTYSVADSAAASDWLKTMLRCVIVALVDTQLITLAKTTRLTSRNVSTINKAKPD